MAANTIQEWYHPPYVHQTFIHSDVREAEKMVPPIDSYHYDLFGRTSSTRSRARRRCALARRFRSANRGGR